MASGSQHYKEIKVNSEIHQGEGSRRESALQVPGIENCLLKGDNFLQIASTYQVGCAWIPHAVRVTSKCQWGDFADIPMSEELRDLGRRVSHKQSTMLLMTVSCGVYHKYPLSFLLFH